MELLESYGFDQASKDKEQRLTTEMPGKTGGEERDQLPPSLPPVDVMGKGGQIFLIRMKPEIQLCV